jgi:diamine N-acetyltransferase
MEFEIAVATLNDLDTLRDLGASTYRAHFAQIWSPAGLHEYVSQQFSASKLIEELSGFQTRYLIVTTQGRPCGYAKISKNRPCLYDFSGTGLELEKIYFLPDTAGKGLGKRVLQRVFNEASAAANSFVWLEVLKSNVAGRRFYESLGFSVIGEKPFATDLMEIGFWVMKSETLRRRLRS